MMWHRYRRPWHGGRGFPIILPFIVFGFILHSFAAFIMTVLTVIILWALIRAVMRNTMVVGTSSQQPHQYYQQPYQPPQQVQYPQYQPYEQGYQASRESYQEGGQQYQYLQPEYEQYEQPQTQYPQQLPPMTQN